MTDIPSEATAARRVIALVSGGLDSCLMAWRAARDGDDVFPLYVFQGTIWESYESAAAAAFVEASAAFIPASAGGRGCNGKLHALQTARMAFPDNYVSRWAVDASVGAPGADSPDEAVDLPGKNLSLLTMAAMAAQANQCSAIDLGLLGGNPFGDARQSFLDAFAALYRESTGCEILVRRPLASVSKSALIREGAGLPLHLTFSCIHPVKGIACGICNKCAERKKAFVEAGVSDATPYAA